MKKRFVVVVILFICVNCNAQLSNNNWLNRCTDSIMNKKGSWKKTSDDLAFPDKTFPRSQYKFINERIDSIYSFLKNSIPSLNGLEPTWYRGMRGDAYRANGPVPYSLNTFFLEYYCNDNYKKLILGDETSNWIYVFVNRFSWFLYEVDTLDINNEGKVSTIFQLPPKVGKWKGMTVYELKGSLTRTVRSVIIGRNELVPWRSITQKQYLTGLKNSYEKQLKRFREGSSYERDYQSRLKYINDYLAMTDEQILEQPVIIDPKVGIWGFKGKFGDENARGFRLVLFTASDKYFDRSLPRYVPQLIQLYWSYDNSPPALHYKNQFEENFPLEKLKAMIDK